MTARKSLSAKTLQTPHIDVRHTPVDLEQRLAMLEETLARQQDEIARLRAELATAHSPHADTRPDVAKTLAAMGETTLVEGEQADAAQPAPQGKRNGATSRRALLKWGGVAAAAGVGVAVLQAVHPVDIAHASTINWTTSAFTVDTETVVSPSSSGYSAPDILQLQIGTGSVYLPNPLKAALSAYDTTGSNYGVYATSQNGYGLYGLTETGVGANGAGLNGSGTGSGTGVRGASQTGIGVQGNSVSGLGASFSGGQAPLLLSPAASAGAPGSGSHVVGEVYVDSNGAQYICVSSGSPGTWRKVAAGVPGASGAITLLANPIRLLDTRSSSPYNAGTSHSVQITGVVVGGISVPTGAVGVVGNVTVVGPTSGGDLRLYPGPALPATSSINFASGQTIANGVVVGLNSSGQLQIQVDMASGAHTNVLFDASGYLA